MTYFLIPTYNEAANVETLITNLRNTLSDQDKFYVFSDDGSSDNSLQLIEKYLAGENYIYLGDGSNHGPGYAFNTGFEWILNHSRNSEDVVVTIEADNTSDLSILPQMLGNIELGSDLALASVYAQGGGFDKTSFFRKFLSFVANMFFRSYFDVKVLTLSSFYRVYKISLLRKIQHNFKQIIEEVGFISMLEILLKAISLKAKIIEVPMVLHTTKRQGKSKMKVFKTTMSYLRFFLQSGKVLSKNTYQTEGKSFTLEQINQ